MISQFRLKLSLSTLLLSALMTAAAMFTKNLSRLKFEQPVVLIGMLNVHYIFCFVLIMVGC